METFFIKKGFHIFSLVLKSQMFDVQNIKWKIFFFSFFKFFFLSLKQKRTTRPQHNNNWKTVKLFFFFDQYLLFNVQ